MRSWGRAPMGAALGVDLTARFTRLARTLLSLAVDLRAVQRTRGSGADGP